MKKIMGLKKAIGEYQRSNSGGCYSPHYGLLMFDFDSYELWTDEFWNFSHTWHTDYRSKTIINLGFEMREENLKVNIANVKKYIEDHAAGWEAYLEREGYKR